MPATGPAKSTEDREYFLFRREPTGRLLGVRQAALDGDLEHTATRSAQLDLRSGHCPLNQTCRRTGARFIASHAAVFDLDLHSLLSRLPLCLNPRRLPVTATAMAKCKIPQLARRHDATFDGWTKRFPWGVMLPALGIGAASWPSQKGARGWQPYRWRLPVRRATICYVRRTDRCSVVPLPKLSQA